MTDWLSEIEDFYGLKTLEYPVNMSVGTIERMARVIRELVNYVREQEGRIHTWNVNKKDAREKAGLSPDAKELLKCSDG